MTTETVNTIKNVKMHGDWIFVLPIVEPREVGGIIIPDTATSQEVTQRGEIVAVTSKNPTDQIIVGAKVLFKRKAAFNKLMLDGIDYLVMKKMNVLGVLLGDRAHEVAALGSNVFLRWELAHSEYERSGLTRPDAYRQMHYTGYVISKGPDALDLEVGDRVFFDQFCGVEKFEESGIRYGFVREDDIYCTNIPSRETILASVEVPI